MSSSFSTKDTALGTNSPAFELWNYCPYLTCGERTNAGTEGRFCGQCSSAFNVCHKCRATNRLLADFCRGCGEELLANAWPLESGLRSPGIELHSIHALQAIEPPFPIQLGAGIPVPPIAADGLLLISLTNGRIVLLGEQSGRQIGALSVPGGIAVTPALHSGTLFVASDKSLYSFDLSAFLDQPSLQQLTPVWSYDSDSERIIQPVLLDENAVFILGAKSRGSVLSAVSQRGGSPVWSEPIELDTELTTPPLLVGTTLVVITIDGKVTMVEASNGNVSQTFPLNRRVNLQATPFVIDNRIILSDLEGHIFELVLTPSGPLINPLFSHHSRISSIAASAHYIALGHMAGVTLLSSRGLLHWTSDTLESVSTTPIVAGESVFVLDDEGSGLLFDVLKSNPLGRMKLLSREGALSPLITQSRIVTVSADGMVVAIGWH